MPSSLTATKIKDTYGQVLHVDGGVTSTPKLVYDGDGTATALNISTTDVQVNNSPVLTDADIGSTVQAYDADLTAWSGKTAPSGTVVGTSDSQALSNKTFSDNPVFSSGTANSVPYLNGSKVLTTGSALTFDGSNLGLGVTPSAWVNSWKAVQVGASGALASRTDVYGTILGQNWFINSAGNDAYIGSSTATAYRQREGQHQWLTAPSGTAGNAISFTQAMTLDASGNLGIGTSSPSAKLTISGNNDLGTANNTLRFVDTDNATQQGQQIGKIEFYTSDASGSGPRTTGYIAGIAEDQYSATYLSFATAVFNGNATEKMRIGSTGNVFIGTADNSDVTIPSGDVAVRVGKLAYNAGAGTGGTIQLTGHSYTDSGACGAFNISAVSTSNQVNYLKFQRQDSFTNAVTDLMLLDLNGNLGLGVTPSAWGATYRMQQIGVSAVVGGRTTAAQAYLAANWYRDGTNNRYITSAAATQYQQDAGAHYWFTAPSGTAGNAISFTQAMTLDTSGNLGIGTTSPGFAIEAYRASSSVDYIVGRFWSDAAATGESRSWIKVEKANNYGGAIGGYLIQGTGGGLILGTQNGTTNPVERMRIDSSGNLLVGTTSNPDTARLHLYVSNQSVSTFESGLATAVNQVVFRNTNGVVGTIQTNGSATSYNTSSDYRLKENVQPMQNALDVVTQLNPVTYTWKADGSDGQGFIAHELQEIVPDCVTGEKDAVDADGNPVYQGVDTSFLSATLTKAIQELKAIVDAQAAEIAELKAKLA